MNIGMILAGGSSQRMNLKINTPKQFVDVCKKPVIAYTLDLLQEDPMIDCIAVALRREYFPLLEEIKNRYGFTKIKWAVESGEHRHDTVYNVLQYLEGRCDDDDIIVSLSAVTPIIDRSVIRKSIEAARDFGAAVAAIPLRSTLLITEKDLDILGVPDRRSYRAITEPHTYKYSVIKKAYDKAYADGCIDEAMTDDVQILHHYGIRQKIIDGNKNFIKITYKSDLEIFEVYIKDRESDIPECV